MEKRFAWERLERLRLEQEERQRAEEEAQRKQELQNRNLEAERQTLATERIARSAAKVEFSEAVAKAASKRAEEEEWKRYLACKPTPDPRVPSELHGFRRSIENQSFLTVENTLKASELLADAVVECLDVSHEKSEQEYSFASLLEEAERLRELLKTKQNQLTAHLLQFHDENVLHNGFQVEACSSRFGYGLWFNLERNMRTKKLNFPKLGMKIDVPKHITNSSLSLVVMEQDFNDEVKRCKAGYHAISPLVEVQLVSSLPESKKVDGWSVRQTLSFEKSFLPVDYCSINAEKLTAIKPTDKIPIPFTITLPRSRYLRHLDSLDDNSESEAKIGCWDHEKHCWSSTGINCLTEDTQRNIITFSTTRLGIFSCIRPTTYWLPYTSWFLHPLPNCTDLTVQLQLETRSNVCFKFEIGRGTVSLRQPVIVGLECTTPRKLLRQMQSAGLCLLPDKETWRLLRTEEEHDFTAEQLFCQDLGYLCRAFCMAWSKWNRTVNAAGDFLCRITELQPLHTANLPLGDTCVHLFAQETSLQSHRVLSLLRRVSFRLRLMVVSDKLQCVLKGSKGVGFGVAADSDTEYLEPPKYDSEQYENTGYGKLHFDSIALLQCTQNNSTEPNSPFFSRKSLEVVENTDPILSETVSEMLFTLKTFSLG